jgi:rhodanese-related sulfurtransferase
MKLNKVYTEVFYDIFYVLLLALITSILLLNTEAVKKSKEVTNAVIVPEVGTISTEELKSALVTPNDTIIIDTREEVFYELGHIPTAINLPISNLEPSYRILQNRIKGAKNIIVYCARESCTDSQKVGERLYQWGHKNIRLYKNGYEGWVQSETLN